MGVKSINFDVTKIKKCYKKAFIIYDMDVNKIFFEKRACGQKLSFKYFIGYDDNDHIRPLYSFLK